MANPLFKMIGWIFKQGMAAVALDERFKAMDVRFNALDERFKSIDTHFEVLEAKVDHVDEKIGLIRNELIARIDGLKDGLKASVEVHERIAALEALVGRKS